MNRISTLALLVAALSFHIAAKAQTTYVDNGTNTNYTLYAGDSLAIVSGTFTGKINSWQAGVKISVAAGAGFKPKDFGYFLGRIYNYGTATLASLNGQGSGFDMVNYGNTTITNDVYLGSNAFLVNNFGATLTFKGGVNVNNSTLVNNGTINGQDDWYVGNGSTLTNNNILNVTGGDIQVNGSTVTNAGKLYTNQKLTLQNAAYNNSCRTIADGTININSSTVTNDGLLWATTAKNNSAITNSGTITSTINGRVKSVNFTNSGTINGSGFLYFTGTTTNNGGGKIGKSGSTTDSLKVYDASRSTNAIFDNNYGTIYPNVRYVAFTAPDTANAYSSCSMEYLSTMTTLPVKWNFFSVSMSNNIPALTWSSEQEAGTTFEVERSYNGSDFNSIAVIPAVNGTTNYSFEDRSLSTQPAVVYYRIKANEVTGAKKYTETKAIRFTANKGMSVQTAPNPFTSQFSINFQSDERTALTIRIFNLTGQLQASKTVNVSRGFNSIAVNEAASLARGFYTVQLIAGNTTIATEKIVKE